MVSTHLMRVDGADIVKNFYKRLEYKPIIISLTTYNSG